MISRLSVVLHPPQLLGRKIVNSALSLDGERNALPQDDLLKV